MNNRFYKHILGFKPSDRKAIKESIDTDWDFILLALVFYLDGWAAVEEKYFDDYDIYLIAKWFRRNTPNSMFERILTAFISKDTKAYNVFMEYYNE